MFHCNTRETLTVQFLVFTGLYAVLPASIGIKGAHRQVLLIKCT